MASKVLNIPSHIVNSGEASNYANIVSGIGIGDVAINLVNNTLTITNIKVSELMSVLGVVSGNIKTLLTSSNINLDSYFVNNKLAPYRLGDIAGYNHAANPPTYFANEKWTNLTLNIASDGSIGWGVILPLQLRRGECLPSTGYVNSWNSIKVVVKLWEDVELDPELYETITVTSNNVTKMFTSKVVNVNIPVDNEDATYVLETRAYYTLNTGGGDIEIEDSPFWTDLTVNKRYPYDLSTVTDGPGGWLMPGIPLGETNYAWSVYVSNDAPTGSNSETYGVPHIGKFRMTFIYYDPEAVQNVQIITETNVVGGITIAPDSSELIAFNPLSSNPSAFYDPDTYFWSIKLDYWDGSTYVQLAYKEGNA